MAGSLCDQTVPSPRTATICCAPQARVLAVRMTMGPRTAGAAVLSASAGRAAVVGSGRPVIIGIASAPRPKGRVVALPDSTGTRVASPAWSGVLHIERTEPPLSAGVLGAPAGGKWSSSGVRYCVRGLAAGSLPTSLGTRVASPAWSGLLHSDRDAAVGGALGSIIGSGTRGGCAGADGETVASVGGCGWRYGS